MEIFAGHEVTRVIEQEYKLNLVAVGSYTYIGKARSDAAETEYVWQIKRLDESGVSVDLAVKYPDGDARFNRRWVDYAILSYI